MSLQLQPLSLNLTKSRRKQLLILASIASISYGLYKVYNLPSVISKRKKITQLVKTLNSLFEVVSNSADSFGVLSKELNEFINSKDDEVPNSVKQLCKISRSKEFNESLGKVMESLTVGILRGYKASEKNELYEVRGVEGVENDMIGSKDKMEDRLIHVQNEVTGVDRVDNGKIGFSEKLINKLFTKEGTGFASVVVGSFARNLVLAFYAESNEKVGPSGSRNSSNGETGSKWVDLICDERCRGLIGDCIQKFVSSAVAVYLDKTLDINTYDELFAGLTNPKHETKVKEFMVSVTNGAIETLVKTSHQVLKSNSDEGLGSGSNVGPGLKEGGASGGEDRWLLRSEVDGASGSVGGDNGWVEKVSSTLAVASNRRLVLDVTGRVTSETVHSFLDFLVKNVYDVLKRSAIVVREDVIERGLDVLRYMSAKSAVIITICLSLYLHMVGGSRVLMPA